MQRSQTVAVSRRAFLRRAAGGAAIALGALLGACGAQAPSDPLALPTLDPSQPTLAVIGATPEPQQGAAVPTAPPATAADAGRTTLVLGGWDSALRPVLAGFERDHPGVEVRFIPAYLDEYHQGLRSALTQGEGAPDVAAVASNWLGAIAARGGLVDLTAPPFDGAALAQDFVAGAWETASVDGKQLAIPWGVYSAAMWYRADLLADAGVEDDPAELAKQAGSWEDLFGLAREIKQVKAERRLFYDARDVFGMAVAQQPLGWLDGAKALIVEKGVRPAQLARLACEQELDAALVSGNFQLAMKSGELASFFADLGVLRYLTENMADSSGAWRVLPPPGGPAAYGVAYLAVTEQAEQPELAWELVKYLTGAASQNSYLKAGGPIPATVAAWADPLYDAPVEYLGGQAPFRMLAEGASALPAGSISAYQRDASDIIDTELSLVVERAKDPEQAMQDAEAALIRKGEGLVA